MSKSNSNLPIITFWRSDLDPSKHKLIDAKYGLALKKLLKMIGAISVKTLPNGAITAKFNSWKSLEKANKDILVPLEILWKGGNIESVFGIPF